MERLPKKKEKHEGVIRTIAKLAVRSFTQPFASHGDHFIKPRQQNKRPFENQPTLFDKDTFHNND